MLAERPLLLEPALSRRIDHRRPEPLVVVGDAPEWERLAARAHELAALLREVPVATAALVPADVPPSARPLVEAFDLVEAVEDLADTAWGEAFAIAPQASSVLAVLLRASGGSLLAESLAYSALQAGREHAEWLASAPPRRAPEPGSRVRVSERDGHIELLLARAERHNALDAQMREELCDALDALVERDDAVVVLRGDGPSFCSGGDLAEFGTLEDPVAGHFVRSGRSAAARLQRIGQRTVAAVHGHCIGAGLELAAFCRHLIATEDSVLWLPENRFGLLPGCGGTVSIPRRIGRRRTLELVLSARQLDARTALDWGLVDDVCPADALDGRVAAATDGLAR